MSGNVLEPDATAVTWSGDEGYSIIFPHGDRDMPDAELALIACGMRLQADPEFVSEMIAWTAKRRA